MHKATHVWSYICRNLDMGFTGLKQRCYKATVLLEVPGENVS